MHLPAILRRFREQSPGQSLVEFALLLPVFLVIVSVAVDLGRIAYARVSIANVAREASFQAAQTPSAYLAGQPCDAADPDANLVICRALLESTGSVITVTPADISLTCTPSCADTMGNTVTVTAAGRFNLLTPIMAVFFGGTTISFSSSATNQIAALPPLVAEESEPPAIAVAPDVAGLAEADALAAITAAGLTVGNRTEDFHATIPAGSVISTDPSAGAMVTEGETVDYVVSKGPSPAQNCNTVSAGFTFTKSPASNKSPVTVTVTDTTTYNPFCVTVWAWSWGDGITTYGKTQTPHVYTNAGPGNKTFVLSLTVTSGTFTSTVGGHSILVKP